VSSLGPSASALGLFLAPGSRCRKKALTGTPHNASSEKRSSAAMISPRYRCLDHFATAHFRVANAERRDT
jgi:hypothetical protein